MQSSTGTLDELAVTVKRSDENLSGTQMGILDVPLNKIEKLPAILFRGSPKTDTKSGNRNFYFK